MTRNTVGICRPLPNASTRLMASGSEIFIGGRGWGWARDKSHRAAAGMVLHRLQVERQRGSAQTSSGSRTYGHGGEVGHILVKKQVTAEEERRVVQRHHVELVLDERSVIHGRGERA